MEAQEAAFIAIADQSMLAQATTDASTALAGIQPTFAAAPTTTAPDSPLTNMDSDAETEPLSEGSADDRAKFYGQLSGTSNTEARQAGQQPAERANSEDSEALSDLAPTPPFSPSQLEQIAHAPVNSKQEVEAESELSQLEDDDNESASSEHSNIGQQEDPIPLLEEQPQPLPSNSLPAHSRSSSTSKTPIKHTNNGRTSSLTPEPESELPQLEIALPAAPEMQPSLSNQSEGKLSTTTEDGEGDEDREVSDRTMIARQARAKRRAAIASLSEKMRSQRKKRRMSQPTDSQEESPGPEDPSAPTETLQPIEEDVQPRKSPRITRASERALSPVQSPDVEMKEPDVPDVPEEEAPVPSEEEEEEAPVPVKKSPVKRGKTGFKKKKPNMSGLLGKKKTKQQLLAEKEEMEEQESERDMMDPDFDERGSAESEPEENEDDAALKHRTKALEALFKIEIEFARLRDRLYIDRMEEVVRDREAVEAGVHPEFVMLNDLIEKRRTSKLDLASKALYHVEEEYDREFAAEERTIWSNWAKEKADMRFTELHKINRQRRQTEQERRLMDRPKDERIAVLLACHSDRRTFQQHLAMQGRPYTEEGLAYAFRRQTVTPESERGLVGLDRDIAMADLEAMALPARSLHPPGFPPPTQMGSSAPPPPEFATPFHPHHPAFPHPNHTQARPPAVSGPSPSAPPKQPPILPAPPSPPRNSYAATSSTYLPSIAPSHHAPTSQPSAIPMPSTSSVFETKPTSTFNQPVRRSPPPNSFFPNQHQPSHQPSAQSAEMSQRPQNNSPVPPSSFMQPQNQPHSLSQAPSQPPTKSEEQPTSSSGFTVKLKPLAQPVS